MKKPPDNESIEILLQGKIKQPSPWFEEALGKIPNREKRHSRFRKFLVVAPLAAAAMLVLATILFLKPIQPASIPEPVVATPQEELDAEWLELFSLADAVADVDSLTDEDTRLAIEFYAFNQ